MCSVIPVCDDLHLGILRLRGRASERRLSEQPARTRSFLLEPKVLAFSKSGTRSRVHRPAYPDYVGIRRFNRNGEVTKFVEIE